MLLVPYPYTLGPYNLGALQANELPGHARTERMHVGGWKD